MERRTKVARKINGQLKVSGAVSNRTWHPLSLQQMHEREFVEVVNGILSGRAEVFQGSLRGATGVRGESGCLLVGRVE